MYELHYQRKKYRRHTCIKGDDRKKTGKFERYFTPETEIIVTLSVEKDRQKIEVTIPVKGTIIRSEQSSSDMYVSIDLVEEVIERSTADTRQNSSQNIRTKATSRKNSLKKKYRNRWKNQSRSSVQNVSVLSQCIRKTHVYRWNFLDMISMYSLMQNQKKKLMSFTNVKMEPMV